MLHLLPSAEIRTGARLLGRPVCASQLANKSFKVTTDRVTCQQLSWPDLLPWAVSTEAKQARDRTLKPKLPRTQTIAAQFVLGYWSK